MLDGPSSMGKERLMPMLVYNFGTDTANGLAIADFTVQFST